MAIAQVSSMQNLSAVLEAARVRNGYASNAPVNEKKITGQADFLATVQKLSSGRAATRTEKVKTAILENGKTVRPAVFQKVETARPAVAQRILGNYVDVMA